MASVPSDEMTALAGRMLAAGDPLTNDQILNAIGRDLEKAGVSWPDHIANDASALRTFLAETLGFTLGVYFDALTTLAGGMLDLDPGKGPNKGA